MIKQKLQDYRQFQPALANERLVAGVDEVGRGPLAGDVVAAAVILDPDKTIDGLNDSKKLSEKKREQLYEEITDKALVWAVGRASPAEIDQINILQASLVAMQRAVNALATRPRHVLVDGNRCPELVMPSTAIVKGDSLVTVISAASIIAKVIRDRELIALDAEYPVYGFARHKGYPTKEHMTALLQNGPCPAHRKSYAPVKKYL